MITIVGIPLYFWHYFSQEIKEVNGISNDNFKLFDKLINEEITSKNLAGVIGQGIELKNIDAQNEKELKMIEDEK